MSEAKNNIFKFENIKTVLLVVHLVAALAFTIALIVVIGIAKTPTC